MKNILVILKGNINLDARVQKEIETFESMGFTVSLAVWNWAPITYAAERLNIIDINLSSHTTYKGALSTFLKTIRFWFICAQIIRKGNYDYIHCNDLDTLGILYFLPSHYYKHVVYDTHELYPEQFPRRSIRYKIWSFIERQLIERVHAIIVPESNRGEFLKKKYNLKYSPSVVNNFARYQNVSPKNIKHELGLEDTKKLICYQGKIDRDRDIEALIEALCLLPEEYALIFFGYGYGNYIEQLKRFIHQKKVQQRVFFYGQVRPQDMTATIAGCDISVALYPDIGINNQLCASNKVFDSIMAENRILTNDYPPHKVLKDYEFVELVSQTDPETIAAGIRTLSRCRVKVSEDIKRKFSWESSYEIFQKIYIRKPNG